MTWYPLALGLVVVAALLSDDTRRRLSRARLARRTSPGIARAMNTETPPVGDTALYVASVAMLLFATGVIYSFLQDWQGLP